MSRKSSVISTKCWEPRTAATWWRGGENASRPAPGTGFRHQLGSCRRLAPPPPPAPGWAMHTDTRTPFPSGGRVADSGRVVVGTDSRDAAASLHKSASDALDPPSAPQLLLSAASTALAHHHRPAQVLVFLVGAVHAR